MVHNECVFCRIRDHSIPITFLYEDERAFVVKDIAPKAPVHLLVIPKEHIPTLGSLTGRKLALMGHLTKLINDMAREQGVANSGYRVVINNGPDTGMEVSHLHLHLLAGQRLGVMA